LAIYIRNFSFEYVKKLTPIAPYILRPINIEANPTNEVNEAIIP